MDDAEPYEQFNVDNDYEGGQWIGGEFYYTSKKEKRQQTREDQLYGIFAEDSDDDERPSRSKKPKADYTKPVGFVSTGVVVPDDKPVPVVVTASAQGTAGLGSAGAGLGFAPGAQGQQGEEDEDEEQVLPTSFGQRIKASAQQKLQKEDMEKKKEKQREALKKADPNFATFEKHTKGIGMKLLEKMGYKAGEGLGRDRSGIAKPIETKLRPKNMGLGHGTQYDDTGVGFTRPSVRAQQDQELKAAAAAGSAPKLWKKKAAGARFQREYKTAAQVLKEAQEQGRGGAGTVTILDMRGPQTRLITNMEDLELKDTSDQGTVVPMPELQHNLKLLVSLTEAELQKLDGRLQQEQDKAALLASEKARLEAEVSSSSVALQRLAALMSEVARCQLNEASTSLAELERTYAALKAGYKEEYVLYNLGAAALPLAIPKLQRHLAGWRPLADPRRGLPELLRWRALLEKDSDREAVFLGAADSANLYHLLLEEVLLPALQRDVSSSWEPRDPEPLLTWLEAWEGALTQALTAHVLESLVMTKLRAAVDGWNPVRETVPIHAWLHPWLPYLGRQLEEVYPALRFKLMSALTAWHPSDGSALILLRPWQRVFDAGDWAIMLDRSIVPKLEAALAALVINPAQQQLDPFNWVLAWHGALPLGRLVSLLEKGFFPKWHQVLYHWLSHSPNFEEVTRWYLGWKGLLPQEVVDQERCRCHFNYALQLMNCTADGMPLPPFDPPQAQPLPPEGGIPGVAGAASGVPLTAAPGGLPAALAAHFAPAPALSLRDLVQSYAEEHSVEFVPKPGRFHEGLQVYSFGNVSVILEPGSAVIRAQIMDRWAPVSLERLLQEQQIRSRVR